MIITDYVVLYSAPGTEQLFAERLALFLLLHCEYHAAFYSPWSFQKLCHNTRTRRTCWHAKATVVAWTTTVPADRTRAHDESRRSTDERWGRMAAANHKPVRDRSNRRRTGTVSGGALHMQRKIWAAADFRNFLAQPNTRKPRKKKFFSWSTDIWSSEKNLKIGHVPNFSLHVQGSPADREQGEFLPVFWRLFSPLGGRRGRLPFKLVWRLAFNIFGDPSISRSPITGIFSSH